jgi:PAS domain S-box-containing protein
LYGNEGHILFYEGTIEDITNRKAAIENQKERQHFIETILDTEPGTVYIYDLRENKNVFVNRDWLISYGYSTEETQGAEDLMSTLIHPDDLPSMAAHHNRLKAVEADKDIFEVECRIHRKDGEWRWVQSRDTIFARNAAGQVTQILGIIHDVTESKKSRNALIESEKKYRQLFENMTSAFAVHKMIYDEHGKPVDYLYLEINPAFEKLTGVPVNVLLGKTLKEIMPDTEEYWIEKFGEVASTGQPLTYTNFSRELGRYYDTYAFCPELGTFAVVFNDVTEKIKAQEEVLKSQRRLQAFFNQSLDGFFFLMFDEPLLWADSIDKEQTLLHIFNTQRFTDANNSMLEQYNITREKFLQSTSRDFFAHDPEQGLHLRRELFNNGHMHLETFERKTDSSPVWFEGDYACLYDDQKRITGFFGIQRDITERKKAEAEIQKLNQELNKRVQELEAKNAELTQFTYTVSHDLKSPLVTINGYLGYLEQDALSGNVERLKQDIQRIHDAASKMHALLNELLELSRIGRMMNEPENIPFAGLVKDALEIVHGQLEAHHVTVQIQPNLPAIYGDRQRLIEVLQNLIENAAKYMGGQSEPQIEIGQLGEENDKPIFFVKDNGMGIAPEYHERIFGLFNKLDAKSEGTGIGLALVKRIIEVHGGRIWVESKEGKGSTFYFTLPVN